MASARSRSARDGLAGAPSLSGGGWLRFTLRSHRALHLMTSALIALVCTLGLLALRAQGASPVITTAAQKRVVLILQEVRLFSIYFTAPYIRPTLLRQQRAHMGIRNLADNPQSACLRQIIVYAKHFHRPPEEFGAQVVRAYRL